jgi:hypothetical protein
MLKKLEVLIAEVKQRQEAAELIQDPLHAGEWESVRVFLSLARDGLEGLEAQMPGSRGLAMRLARKG